MAAYLASQAVKENNSLKFNYKYVTLSTAFPNFNFINNYKVPVAKQIINNIG